MRPSLTFVVLVGHKRCKLDSIKSAFLFVVIALAREGFRMLELWNVWTKTNENSYR